MKKVLLSIAIITGFLFASGQEIEIRYHDNLVNNSTITVYGNQSADVIEFHLTLKNTTSTDLNMYVRRIVNSAVTGTDNSFCFGVNCYPPFVDTSAVVTVIPAGMEDFSFAGDYYPYGNQGVSSITYEFFDNTTLANRVAAEVTVNYLATVPFALIDGDVELVNGTTVVEFTSDIQTSLMEKQLLLVNNTGESAEIYVRRIINEQVSGSENSFCFGVICYPPFVDTSSVVTILEPGAVDSSFRADYIPNGNAGKTSITYEFYNMAKGRAEIRESVTVIFNLSGVGVDEKIQAIRRTYPNPASSSVTIEYDLKPGTADARLIVRNLAGQVVGQVPVDRHANKVDVDVSWLASGIYTITLIDGSLVVDNNKIVVKH